MANSSQEDRDSLRNQAYRTLRDGKCANCDQWAETVLELLGEVELLHARLDESRRARASQY